MALCGEGGLGIKFCRLIVVPGAKKAEEGQLQPILQGLYLREGTVCGNND